MRLMNNQTKSQRKATIRTKEEKATTKCCGYCENCTTIGLRLARLGSICFSKRKAAPGIRRVRFTQCTLRQASIREKKGTSLGKYKSKIIISILLHHLHRRISYLTPNDTPKIQHPKEVDVRVRIFGETHCIDPQKPKTKIKMKDAKKYKAIYCVTCRIGCRSSQRIWSMNVVL